jgi:hypothetical protein
MTFRLEKQGFPNRAKLQITTSAAMPYSIYQACLATGIQSNTVYCQRAICEALSRDLGIPLQALLDDLPTPRGPSAHLFNPDEQTMNRYLTRVGPGAADEDVR